MKLTISGVTFSAAIVRSPSFSRSSSSTTMMMRPARISSTASGTETKGMPYCIERYGDYLRWMVRSDGPLPFAVQSKSPAKGWQLETLPGVALPDPPAIPPARITVALIVRHGPSARYVNIDSWAGFLPSVQHHGPDSAIPAIIADFFRPRG